MLEGAQFVRTTCTGEGTDDRLLRGHGGSRGVVGVEIGVGRLPVDGGAGVRLPVDGGAGVRLPVDGGAGVRLPVDGGAGVRLPVDGGAGVRLPVDGGAGVRVNDNIKEWYHSVRTGMFNGIFQVRCHRV